MKRHTVVLAVAMAAMLCVLPVRAQTKAHRVLFALTSSDEADLQLTLNNVRNLMSGLSPEPVEIEIVAYGPGVAFLKKDGPDAGDIQKLESPHVRFIACGNAMRKQHLEASDLVAGSEVVSAGIVEVVRKQEQGWTTWNWVATSSRLPPGSCCSRAGPCCPVLPARAAIG